MLYCERDVRIMAFEENPFEHILYEFSMYLDTSLHQSDNQFITNLLVDSRLVHLRNLAYFFDKKRHYDIHASVYVNSPESCLIETSQLREIYYRTNCAACHMSLERQKPNFKQKTAECERQAFKMLVPYIKSYLNLLDIDLKPEFSAFWNDKRTQAEALAIRQKTVSIII